MTNDEIIEMARRAGIHGDAYLLYQHRLEAFAKLVAAKAIAKDREDFDIDELCARQNKIGYKQGYRAGQFAEREACANLCWKNQDDNAFVNAYNGKRLDLLCSELIRTRGEK